MFKKSAVMLLVVGAMLFGGTSAAHAVESDADAGPGSVTALPAVIPQGGESIITFPGGSFEPRERVDISLTGEDASAANLASVAPVERTVASTTMTADADGGLVTTFTAPTTGTGAYSLSFSGTRSYGVTVTVTVTAAQIEVPSGVVVSSDPSTARTGGGGSPIVVAVGVVSIAVGMVALVIGLMRRRRRA